MLRQSGNVSAYVQSRPLRLGFLTSPRDRQRISSALTINTWIWGGRYNPIVPLYRSRGRSRRTPHANVEGTKGYLRLFEPDYYVVDDAAKALELDEARILRLKDFLDPLKKAPPRCASVTSLYDYLFETETRFVSRQASVMLLPQATPYVPQQLVDVMFGDFSDSEFGRNAREHYRRTMDAVEMPLDAERFMRAAVGELGATPLDVGSYGFEVRSGWIPSALTILLLDATQPLDLLDCWNLRALGWPVVPIHVRWPTTIKKTLREIIDAHQPQGGVESHRAVTVFKSRSVNDSAFRAFRDDVLGPSSPVVSHHLYPRMWSPEMHEPDHVRRPKLIADASRQSGTMSDDGRLMLEPLAPPFAKRKSEWANILRIQAWPQNDQAELVPWDLKQLNRIMEIPDRDVHASSDGLVLATNPATMSAHCRILNGVTIATEWFRQKGLSTSLSSAGRTTLELLRAIGGPFGATLLTNKDLLELLNKMASGQVERDTNGSKVPTGRVAYRQTLMRVLKNNQHRLESLVDYGVLKVGLSTKCPECTQSNWYSLSQIADRLRCDRCLQEFPFPASRPTETDWTYRTQGAFATEDYAQGGYSVSLALRFLCDRLTTQMTWSPSLKLTDSSGTEREADFVAWRSDALGRDEPQLILGECKSHNEFKRDDFQRFAGLMKLFPQAWLVLATLRDGLSEREMAETSELANQRRHWDEFGLGYSPVIVLCARELLTSPDCWTEVDADFPHHIKFQHGHLALSALAATTQHLYLGSPWTWFDPGALRASGRRRAARKSDRSKARKPSGARVKR